MHTHAVEAGVLFSAVFLVSILIPLLLLVCEEGRSRSHGITI
jgi:hypothetical protein